MTCTASTAAVRSDSLSAVPLPRRATAQLRLALDCLADAPTDAPEVVPLRPHVERLRVVLQPQLAWPVRPQRARMPDGSAAARRVDFYEWIVTRRRRAQIAARHALDGVGSN